MDIPKPKQKRHHSPEIQKLYDEIKAKKEEIAKKRAAESATNKAVRAAEVRVSWLLLRYVQHGLQNGNVNMKELVTAVAGACTPREDYPKEKAEKDKDALRLFLQKNQRS